MSDKNDDVNMAVAAVSSRSEDTVMADQPRPPRNLQDLMRYSIEAGGNSAVGNIRPMDEESKRFLNEALQSMTVDVISEMKKALATLERGSCTEEECDDAFDSLLELVDKIDFANDFHRIGGFRIFNPGLNSDNNQIRWRCCELMAELCQNNPYCQERSVEEGYLPKLLHLVSDDSSDIVRIKALYALSCLVRESQTALKQFAENDGFSVILKALQSDCDKLKIKSSFLLSSIFSQSPELKTEVIDMGFVQQLVGLIIENKCNYAVVEHLLSALNVLVVDFDNAKTECRRPELQLRSVLQDIISEAKGKDDIREVVEYARNLEKIVCDSDNDDPEEDR